MAKKTLSSEIAENITELKKLKDKDPTNQELSDKLQDMFDALHQAQGKEWEEQVEKYKAAKLALDEAKQAAQEAINDLSKTATTIAKVANAIEKVLAAIALVL
jgi:protein-disulfide isomerase